MYRAIFFVKCKHTINTYNVHVIFEFRLQVLRTIFFCSIGSVVFLFTYLLKQHTGPCPLWHCNHVTIDQSQASFFPAFPTKSDGFWRNVWSTCSTVVLLGTVCEVFFFWFRFFFCCFFFLGKSFIVCHQFKICLYEIWSFFKKELNSRMLSFSFHKTWNDHRWLVPFENFKILCKHRSASSFPSQFTMWLFCFYHRSISISHQVIKVVDGLFIILHSQSFVEAVDSFCVLGCENWRHESVHSIC